MDPADFERSRGDWTDGFATADTARTLPLHLSAATMAAAIYMDVTHSDV